jgi:RNA polymerase sigma factor (sigma-70 family)
MHDARDAEDKRLFEAGEHKQLVGNYFDYVRVLSRARSKNAYDADEIASMVFIRLLRWLERGPQLRWPFRVIVGRSVGYTAADYYRGVPRDSELPDDWDAAGKNPHDDWIEREDLYALLAPLPRRAREVATLRYVVGLTHAQIAKQLGIRRNNVDQALLRAHDKLRELLDDA